RMLETIREFGQMQLVDSDDEADARQTYRRWAIDIANRQAKRIMSPQQFEAIDAIRVEEGNLSDVMRQSINDDDPRTLMQILACLGPFWTIRGEHGRAMSIGDAIGAVVDGWHPPQCLADSTRTALTVLFLPVWFLLGAASKPIHDLLIRLGPGEGR